MSKAMKIAIGVTIAVLILAVSVWTTILRKKTVLPPKEDPKKTGGFTLSIGIPKVPSNLIPILELSSEAKQITNLIFDGLTNPKGLDGNLTPMYVNALAADIIQDPTDRTINRIELETGIKWHNGEDFTADDVIYTWDAIHQSKSPLRVRLDRFIRRFRKLDDFTIEVRLVEERIAERVQDLLSFKIIPQTYNPKEESERFLPKNLNAETPVVNKFNSTPVGTGAYKIAKRPAETEIILKAVALSRYGKPKIDGIYIKRYPGWDVIVRGLGDGSVKLAAGVPLNYWPHLDKKNLTKREYFPYNFYSLVYNVSSPPLNNINFRLALNHSTDRKLLAATFMPDEPNSDMYVNESIYSHNYDHVKDKPSKYKTNVKFDQSKARTMFDNLDLSDEERTVHFLYCSIKDGEYANRLAESYKEMMGKVGIQVKLENAPSIASYSSRLKRRDFQIAFILYDRLDHFFELYDFFEKGAPKNHSSFVHPQLTRKLSELKLTLAYEDIESITINIHSIIDSNAPICPLFTLPRRAYHTPKLRNLILNPESYYDMPHQMALN